VQIVRRPLAPGENQSRIALAECSSGGLALAATWLALKLPWPICLFHALTGHPCLTCGATRSAVAFFHAQFFAAFQWNPLAFVFLLCVVDLQRLCARRYHHARATPAHCAPECEREEIYSRLHHRAFRLKIGVYSLDDESIFVAAAFALARPPR